MCNNGYNILLTKEGATLTHNPTGKSHFYPKDPSSTSYYIPLTAAPPPRTHHASPTPHHIHNVVRHEHDAERAAFYNLTFGSCPPSTLLKALDIYFTLPDMSAAQFRRNQPQLPQTDMSHLRRQRSGTRPSANPSDPPTPAIPTIEDNPYEIDATIHDMPTPSPPFNSKFHIIVKTMATRAILHADDTGNYPINSRRGHKYIKIAIFNGYIFYVPMKDLTGPTQAAAYTAILTKCKTHGHTPHVLNTDGATYPEVETLLTRMNIQHTLVPRRGLHNRNLAERAIQTAKSHLLGTLAAAHHSFDPHDWDLALPMAELTLNLLLPCASNKKISAYEGFYNAKYDFHAHPLAPFGTRVQTLRYPADRGPFEQHSTSQFYIGPDLSSYRGHRCIQQPSRNDPRPWTVHHSIQWHPTLFRMPHSSPAEILSRSIDIVHQSLLDIAANPLYCGSQQILKTKANTLIDTWTDIQSLLTFPIVHDNESHTPSYGALPPPRRSRTLTLTDPALVGTSDTTPINPPTRNRGRQKRVAAAAPPDPSPPDPPQPPPEPTHENQDQPLPQGLNLRRRPSPKRVTFAPDEEADPRARARLPQEQPMRRITTRSTTAHTSPHHAFGVIGESSGVTAPVTAAPYEPTPFAAPERPHPIAEPQLTRREAMASADAHMYRCADEDEARRLLNKDRSLATMYPIYPHDIPQSHKDTIMGIAAVYKKKSTTTATTYRARWAANSSRHEYLGPTSSRVAESATVHMLLNAVISEDAEFATIDIKDFYLGTMLDHLVYLKINKEMFSPAVTEEFELSKFIQDNKWIYFAVQRTIYGLPQAGKIAQDKLVTVLQTGGYTETRTPGLFRHTQRSTTFVLIVDDFGIKYKTQDDLDHLMATLRKAYTISIDATGSQILGYTIQRDRIARTLTLSMPEAIPRIIAKYRPTWEHENIRGAQSPGIYAAPIFGTTPTTPESDNEPTPLSPDEIHEIQRVLGSCQYIALSIMPSIQTACGEIASEVNKATTKTQAKIDRLLRYMAAYPNPTRVYHASEMVLTIQSDTSHDSRPGSKDVVGGVFYLGFKNNPYKVNAPFATISKQLQWVVNSAAESEYSGLFFNGQQGYNFRETLQDLGFPQTNPTIILCDNTTAIGLATQTVKPKKAKYFDRRWNWIQEAVKRKFFNIQKIDGKVNIADFFTKILPVSRHLALVPFIETHPPQIHNKFQTTRYLRTGAWLREKQQLQNAYPNE